MSAVGAWAVYARPPFSLVHTCVFFPKHWGKSAASQSSRVCVHALVEGVCELLSQHSALPAEHDLLQGRGPVTPIPAEATSDFVIRNWKINKLL